MWCRSSSSRIMDGGARKSSSLRFAQSDLRNPLPPDLRFFPDPANGYEYRISTSERSVWITFRRRTFRKPTRWFETTNGTSSPACDRERLVRVRPKAVVTIDPFVDIIGRQFKQPKEGLDSTTVRWPTCGEPCPAGFPTVIVGTRTDRAAFSSALVSRPSGSRGTCFLKSPP